MRTCPGVAVYLHEGEDRLNSPNVTGTQYLEDPPFWDRLLGLSGFLEPPDAMPAEYLQVSEWWEISRQRATTLGCRQSMLMC